MSSGDRICSYTGLWSVLCRSCMNNKPHFKPEDECARFGSTFSTPIEKLTKKLLKELPRCQFHDGCQNVATWMFDTNILACEQHYAPTLWGHTWTQLQYANTLYELQKLIEK